MGVFSPALSIGFGGETVAKKKVRILIAIASPDWSYAPQEVVELDQDLAEKWIGSGIAEPVRSDNELETAVKEPAEKAAKRTGKARKA